jgi:hypothetical protein
MKKIYFLSGGSISDDWTPTVNEIEDINPDEIIIISNTEVYIEGNWGKLFDVLNPWLVKNNKFAYIITPHLDNINIRSNIIAEKSYAMVESVIPLYENKNYKTLVWDRVYCSYMYRPSESRGRLIDMLIENSLLEHGYVTYHNTSVKTHDDFTYYRKTPLTFEQESYTKSSVDHFTDPYLYRNSFIDIVAEASFEPGNCFLTEKTIRAVCHEKPFVTIGSPGFHTEYLKNYFNFKLYDEIIDYSFDTEPNLQKRINGIISNLKKLIKHKAELTVYYEMIYDKIKHNKQQLENIYNDPNKIIPRPLRFMLDANLEYAIHGTDSSLTRLIQKYKKQNG